MRRNTWGVGLSVQRDDLRAPGLINKTPESARRSNLRRGLGFSGLIAATIAATLLLPTPGVAAECDRQCIGTKLDFCAPENLRQLSALVLPSRPGITWLANSEGFAYARQSTDDVILYRVDIPSRQRTVVVAASTILSLVPEADRVAAVSLEPNALTLDANGTSVRLVAKGQTYRFDLATRAITPVVREKSTSVSPDGQFHVFSRNHNLFSSGPDDKVVQLTSDGELWHSFSSGVADTQPSDRAILSGKLDSNAPWIGWIGNGPHFYVLRQDLRPVGDLWMIDTTTPGRPRLITQKMPLPGDQNLPKQELMIIDARDGSTVHVQTDGWDHIGNLDTGAGGLWPSKDGNTLYFARMTRGYGVVELCAADVKSGRVRVILKEAPADGVSTRMADFIELDDGFLWRTDRDGFQHYALYDRSGRFIRTVTPERTTTETIRHVDRANKRIIYASFDNPDLRNPAQIRMRSASWKTGKSIALDTEDAHHETSMSPDGKWYVDTMSRPDQPPRMVLRSSDGKIAMEVDDSNAVALRTAGWIVPEPFQVSAADGKTPLHGVMWRPNGVAETAALPIVADVYPGPSMETVPFLFQLAPETAQLASLGFAVVRSGQRGGSPIPGKAYHRYARTFGSVRDYPIADNKAVLEGLAKRNPTLDINRVGIIGHSGGGFMSATAILLEPDFYKVAVSASGNHDNNVYEMGSSEYHFGDPFTGPAGSKTGYATNQELANRLKGKLLIIHGMLDDDVPVANSLRLMDALIRADKDFDTLILPSQRHAYEGPYKDYVRMQRWRYLIRWLQ
jgi:dipeptidyl-peptidase 4